MSYLNAKKGFTLVELLITISIITILTTVGLIIYSSAGEKARDSKRKSDLRAIAQAIEIYNQKNRAYPPSLEDLTSEYIDSLPTDPSPGVGYTYTLNGNCFYLTTKLENPQDSDRNGDPPGKYKDCDNNPFSDGQLFVITSKDTQ